MVTSVTPVLEQHMPLAQAHVRGQDAHVRFDFVAYIDSSTSTAQLANETPEQSHVAARNRAGEYCCNQQYSVTAITTSTGAIAERYAYSAYGQPTILDASGSILNASAISNRYTYTGREWDATLGLHHFRARWMSPSAGRFLGRDPMRYIDGPNSYGLFGNSVHGALDPTGTRTELRTVCDYSYTPCTVESDEGGCYCIYEITKFCISVKRDDITMPKENDGWHYFPVVMFRFTSPERREIPDDFCGSCKELMPPPKPPLPIGFQKQEDSGWIGLPDPPFVS